MTYYTEINKMNKKLEQILIECKKKDRIISEKDLIYNLTKMFEVSEKSIIKRIDLLKEMGKVNIHDDGCIEWL